MTDRVELIKQTLATKLATTFLEITDDSWQHAGHAGARQGGHFTVKIASPLFAGLNSIKRHRLVYDAVADLMTSEIHALSIKAFTPDEIASDC